MLEEILLDVAGLLKMIAESKDQKRSIAKAKQALEMDALDLAADEAARKVLGG